MESLPQIPSFRDGGAPQIYKYPQSQEQNKLRRGQGVSVFGGIPQFQTNWKSTLGTPHPPGWGMGDPEAVSRQRRNIDWLVGGQGSLAWQAEIGPRWLRVGPKAQGGLH